jgi:alpha/beta superfamily hydrolase
MGSDLSIVQVTIPGNCGQLEGRLLYSSEEISDTGVIICPPHPLLAGNLDNNVVQAVAKKMAASLPVLLFNYPAVGKSTNPRPDLPLFEYWNALDQGSDYGMIAEEVKKVFAWSAGYFQRFHLIGYSFGALMALTAISPQARSYTAIAPPLSACDFSSLPSLSLPICLITAENDTLLTAPVLLPKQKNILHTSIKDADHFFLKREKEIAEQVAEFIEENSSRLG